MLFYIHVRSNFVQTCKKKNIKLITVVSYIMAYNVCQAFQAGQAQKSHACVFMKHVRQTLRRFIW